jgi:hypothetical protein
LKSFSKIFSVACGLVDSCHRPNRPLDTYIIPHLSGFVKRNFRFRRTFFTRCTLSPIMVSLVGTSSLHLYYTTLCGFCQGIFQKFLKNFRKLPQTVFIIDYSQRLFALPLDYIIIISHYTCKVNTFIKTFFISSLCTITG